MILGAILKNDTQQSRLIWRNSLSPLKNGTIKAITGGSCGRVITTKSLRSQKYFGLK
jgi:hypothetical protein